MRVETGVGAVGAKRSAALSEFYVAMRGFTAKTV